MDNKYTDYLRFQKPTDKHQEHQNGVNILQRSMVIHPGYKLIYFKPGKCAGTSIFRRTLQPMGGWISHKDTPQQYNEWLHNITDEHLNQYFTFIFARNPFTRLVSCWNDIDRLGITSPTSGVGKYADFKEFVKKGVPFNGPAGPGIPTQLHYQLQTSLFETPDRNKRYISFVGRVENIQEDWKRFCDKTGIPYKPMVHDKKRINFPHSSLYDEETKNIVAKWYKRDLEFFNYKFEDLK